MEFNKERYLSIALAIIFIVVGVVLYERPSDGSPDGKYFKIETLTESLDIYEISADYPVGDKVGIDRAYDFVMDEVSEFKRIAKRDVSEARERGVTSRFSLDIGLENYETSDYLSYVFYISEYMGGANVNNIVRTFVFNKNLGSEVTLSNILSESYEDEFINLLKNNLLSRSESHGVSPDVVSELSLGGLNSFYVTESSITVLFSKYVIAPGAAGIIEVTAPRG